ncbi:MAG: protein kinase domain-containing protein [Gemmatimonadaceae bacterium]
MNTHLEAPARLSASLADRYRIERELGHGGMATVFLAEDLKHRRRVALKVLNQDVAAAVGPARFLKEIEIAASLAHPNVLPLYDSGEADGFLYYVMPYVEGESLRDLLVREKQLSVEDAIRITCDIADGVQYAHQHGIVHRDIKPENILLQDGRAVVADFGIARAVSASAKESLTSSGVILGTAQYMSPEQALGERSIGLRSDIYALGCVLYEMLAGETPYTGPTIQSIISRHAVADIPSIRILRPDVPQDVDDIIRKALGKVPASRQSSAGSFAQSLRSYATDSRWRRLRRKRRLAVVGAVAVTVITATLVIAKAIMAGPLEQNDFILAADFEGPPRDPAIAAAFRDLVTTSLGQSRFFRVIERRQLNEIMRQAGIAETTFVDLELARQLAQRSSVRAVLVGSINPLGSGYSAVLHVVSAEDGAPLASAVATASGPNWQHALVNTAEAEVNQLRAELGERRGAITENRPLRDVATPSFEAFRYYSAALDASLMRGDFAGSNKLLEHAIALDSGFASAWASRGANFLTERQLDSARFAYNKALSFPHRLAAPERYRLKGDIAYAIDHDVPAAVKWYDLYVAEMPHSRSGRNNRGLYRSALGQYEQAEADLREAVELNPFGPDLIQPNLLNLAAVQVVLGHREQARQTSTKLSGPFAQYMEILLAMAESRWADADRASLAVISKSEPQNLFRTNAVTAHASALAARGSVLLADSILRDAVSSSKGSTARWYERARQMLATVAGQRLGDAALSASDTSLAAETLRALWAAESGDTVAARALLKKTKGMSRRDSAMIGSGPTLVESWIAFRAGRWADVVERLGPVALNGENDPTSLDRPNSFVERWLVASAYERMGKLDSAAKYFEMVLQPTRMPPGHYALRGFSYGFAHARLAETHRRRGDKGRESEHLAAVLKTFSQPDKITLPIVARAGGLSDSAVAAGSKTSASRADGMK